MPWPRFCASSSRAKVESPLILIRSIGSICTAILRLIDPPKRVAPSVTVQKPDFGIGPLAAGVERRRDMARNPPGRHQHCIEAHVADAGVGVVREPHLRGGRHPLALARGYRPGGIVQVLARLDLDEYQ